MKISEAKKIGKEILNNKLKHIRVPFIKKHLKNVKITSPKETTHLLKKYEERGAKTNLERAKAWNKEGRIYNSFPYEVEGKEVKILPPVITVNPKWVKEKVEELRGKGLEDFRKAEKSVLRGAIKHELGHLIDFLGRMDRLKQKYVPIPAESFERRVRKKFEDYVLGRKDKFEVPKAEFEAEAIAHYLTELQNHKLRRKLEEV